MVFSSVALGDLVELKRGYDLPKPSRRDGAVPVVSSCGVSGRHDTARARGPGVVTGRTGTIGKVFYIDEDFWPLNTTLYVRDFKGNDPRFIAGVLATLDFTVYDDKAVISGVSRLDLLDATVPRPPLRRQRTIAGALSLLDRRARVLQRLDLKLGEIARTLFRLLPVRDPMSVAELCERVGNGGTPRRNEPAYWNGGIPWVRSGELLDAPLAWSSETITDRGLEESACRLWPAGTVLVAMYASPTVGRIGLLVNEAAANQACCALVPRDRYGAGFVFHALLATRERLQRLATGAAQQNINQRIVRSHEVAVPDAPTARAFSARVAPLHAQRAMHMRELNSLTRLRATLLPELISGRLAL